MYNHLQSKVYNHLQSKVYNHLQGMPLPALGLVRSPNIASAELVKEKSNNYWTITCYNNYYQHCVIQ